LGGCNAEFVVEDGEMVGETQHAWTRGPACVTSDADAAAYCFPYTTSTSSYTSRGITVNADDMQAAWNSWKPRIVAAGSDYRVQFDDTSKTVSEGVAYAMYLSMIMDDKTLFDGLWRYYNRYKTEDGLMHWEVQNGVVVGTGAATDGDEDAALALVGACVKNVKGVWSGTTNGYCAAARNLIGRIYASEIDKAGAGNDSSGNTDGGLSTNTGGEQMPGDQWEMPTQFPQGIINPSYLDFAAMRVFKDFTGQTGWQTAIDRNKSILNTPKTNTTVNYCRNGAWNGSDCGRATGPGTHCSKLPAQWITYGGACQEVWWQNGTSDAGDRSCKWSYDGARFAWRMARYKLWYGSSDTWANTTINNEVGAFFAGVGDGNINQGFNLNGTTSSVAGNGTFFLANNASALYAADSASLVKFNCGASSTGVSTNLQTAYTNLKNASDGGSYYNGAWKAFGLMMLTGMDKNFCAMAGCTTGLVDPTGTTCTTPGTPTATASPSSGAVTLTWGAASNAASYDVQRATQTSGVCGTYTTLGNTTALTYTSSSLTNGQPYCFKVIAKAACGSTATSAVVVSTPTTSGGGTTPGTTPCASLCTPANLPSSSPATMNGTFTANSFQSGSLGSVARCVETTANLYGANCGNFGTTRTFKVNNVTIACTGNFTLPAKRNNGYCFQATADSVNTSAYFTTW
jgi:hypothetical protein